MATCRSHLHQEKSIIVIIIIIIIIICPRYQGSRWIREKISIRNCRSDHYSGQSSRTNEVVKQNAVVSLYICHYYYN